jgi:hypothetical protein
MTGRIKSGEGTLIGNAGEFYVAAELLKRGVIAALAPRNAPAFDILAAKGKKTVRVRVKTKSAEYTDWQWMVKKDGHIFRDLGKTDDFTILVNLTSETKDLTFLLCPHSSSMIGSLPTSKSGFALRGKTVGHMTHPTKSAISVIQSTKAFSNSICTTGMPCGSDLRNS